MATYKSSTKYSDTNGWSTLQWIIATVIGIVIFCEILYLSTSTFVSFVNYKVALTSDYQYAKLAPNNIEPSLFYLTIMCVFIYLFILLKTAFSWINRPDTFQPVLYTVAALVPIIMIAFQYKSTDEYMYPYIKDLYEKTIVSNPNFSNSTVGLQVHKALLSNDYTTLKIISNNIDNFKPMEFKFNKIAEVVNLLPLPNSVYKFNNTTNNGSGFVSVADYKQFYTELLVEFKASEIASRKEFIYLIDSINPDKF
jgi:hypothetical protein